MSYTLKLRKEDFNLVELLAKSGRIHFDDYMNELYEELQNITPTEENNILILESDGCRDITDSLLEPLEIAYILIESNGDDYEDLEIRYDPRVSDTSDYALIDKSHCQFLFTESKVRELLDAPVSDIALKINSLLNPFAMYPPLRMLSTDFTVLSCIEGDYALDQDMSIEFNEFVPRNGQNSIWYNGPIATITYKDFKLKLSAVGETTFNLCVDVSNTKKYLMTDFESVVEMLINRNAIEDVRNKFQNDELFERLVNDGLIEVDNHNALELEVSVIGKVSPLEVVELDDCYILDAIEAITYNVEAYI